MNVKIEKLKDEIVSVPVYIDPPENGWVIIFPKDKTVKQAATALMDLVEDAVGVISIDLIAEKGKIVYGVLINFGRKEEEED